MAIDYLKEKFGVLVHTLLERYNKSRVEINRPDWDIYWLRMCELVKTRSHDAQTQHGCVIVTEENHILSIGYNGFPRNLPEEIESQLPNLRPDKYDWMAHSERNALANCPVRPVNCRAYITGKPCDDCLYAMWQHGITSVCFTGGYVLNKNASNYSDNDDWRHIFLKGTQMEYKEVPRNLVGDIKIEIPHSNLPDNDDRFNMDSTGI